MHGVVLSRNSQTGGAIKLETALSKVEISDIGLQHALVFLWQKIHIINMVLVHLEWFAEWLPWACSHPLLSKDAKLFWCSSPSQVSGSDALAWAGDRCVGVWSFTVHMPACVPWTFDTWFAEGLRVASLSDAQVVELPVLWTVYHLAEFAAAVANSLPFAMYLHGFINLCHAGFDDLSIHAPSSQKGPCLLALHRAVASLLGSQDQLSQPLRVAEPAASTASMASISLWLHQGAWAGT